MWYIVLFAALLGADQLIKLWTVEHLALGESAAFLPGIVRLTRVHNYGAAWSSFSGQTTALAVVTVLLMAAVAYLLVRRIVRHPLGVIAGVMILAGGVGNLIDRLFRGYVVDMFDLTLFSYPVFNFAGFPGGLLRQLHGPADAVAETGAFRLDHRHTIPPNA